jgi:hypothetical protein
MGLLPVVLAFLMVQGPPVALAGAPAVDPERLSQPQAGQSPRGEQPAAQQPPGEQQQAGQQPPGQQPAQQQPAQQQPAQQQQKPQRTPARTGASAGSDPFSIEHLREELERKPTIVFVVPDADIPRFKVEVEGKRWELPTFQERMARAIPKMPVQVPFGGMLASDMARLNTPPEFFGSAPFTNGDLLKMEALSGAYGLAGALIKKAIEARQAAEVAQIRAQIHQELADIDEHNARVAAGQSDDAAGQKKADKDKKKPDEKKKK